MASCMARQARQLNHPIRLVLIHTAPHETRDEVTRGGHAMKRSQHLIPNICRTGLGPNQKARVFEGDGARRMVQQSGGGGMNDNGRYQHDRYDDLVVGCIVSLNLLTARWDAANFCLFHSS